MTSLEKFIRKHFIIDSEVELHLPAILADMQIELDDGNYDDDFGRVSEYTLHDAFDDKLYALLDTVA